MRNAILVIICAGCLYWGATLAPVPDSGLAFGPSSAQAASYTKHPKRTAAEKRAIKRWGYRVGRWWDECDRYWPRRQLSVCMRVIYVESRGRPGAHNGQYHGLFQQSQRGVSVNLFRWYHSIRRAHKLWKSRGWQPWPWL